MRRLSVLILLVFNVLTALSQVNVEARIDPIEILIGQQAQVVLTVHADENANIEWPMLKPRQLLNEGVEVVHVQHPTQHEMVLTVTSFDGRLYHLDPFSVKVNGREYKTADLALKVVEVEVDTTKLDKFYGPRDVQDNPFLWSEWASVFWLSLLVILLSVVGYYLFLRLRDNKPIVVRIKMVKRLLPHQKAMKEIEQIKTDRLVTSENQKAYYTKLTDTLRRYIEERYGFSAMEMTSSEIIERLMASADEQSLSELSQLFLTADLVKFAKYSTLINENDANLVSAVDFINQTKLENQPTQEIVKPELSAADQRTQKTRRLLKAVIWLLAIATVGLFAYIVYSMYQLLV
ncbi:MAG: hypothetical protein ILA25_05360 [Prevotella sp.]|nr:hypothetical protein [Prevotella sp.]